MTDLIKNTLNASTMGAKTVEELNELEKIEYHKWLADVSLSNYQQLKEGK